jgi:tungstate transport system ATP-binding protein
VNSSNHGFSHYALEASGLSAVLGGRKVLEIPSLQVNKNEVMMIIGPNGSGKSTLLLCLALLIKPAAGTIAYNGKAISGDNSILQLHRRLAVVLQEPLLLNETVWDNVMLGLRLRSVKHDEADVRTRKWLERFGIAHLAKRQARTLSGGEAKRASLARAFVLNPEVLFLDEPFTALDSPTRQSLLEDFENVLRETRVTTVMVTHDRNEALVLADRVAVLMNGSIRQIGTAEEVFGSPADEEVACFVEAGNILNGIISSATSGLASIAVKGQQLEAVSDLPEGSKVTVYMHYEDVVVSIPSDGAPATSARNRLRARITRVLPQGSQYKVIMDCGFGLTSIITRQSFNDLGLGIGMEVTATFKASSVHLIPSRGRPLSCGQAGS